MRDLLEILRVQRHDFVNHLQVILGLLQMKKYDRAQDYVRKIGRELGRAGVVAGLSCPEIVSVILTSELAAGKKGLVLQSTIETGLEKGLEAGFAVAEIVREMLDTAFCLAEAGGCAAGGIDFKVSEKTGEYHFQVSFPCRESADSLALAAGKTFLTEAAAQIRGRLVTGRFAEGAFFISLAVPVKKDGSFSRASAAEAEPTYQSGDDPG